MRNLISVFTRVLACALALTLLPPAIAQLWRSIRRCNRDA